MKYKRIAFCGYARAGKDTAAEPLIELGYKRVCFGDIIKSQVDALCYANLGHSAFVTDDERKNNIRPLLELWGDINYTNICNQFFSELPELAVNTRLVRSTEGLKWIANGGIIILIRKLGSIGASTWEQDALVELGSKCHISYVIDNYGTREDLHNVILNIINQ